jgi:nicotinamidase-related amidase
MLGGVGHALVSAVEEAVFFHTVARLSQAELQVKGDDPWTEHYSALGPELGGTGQGGRNERLVAALTGFDAIIVAGQAKSHCVTWTVADLLAHLQAVNPAAVGRVYLLEDCTSPVVVPGAIDYTDEADRAFDQFQDAGMHRVTSSVPMREWPGAISQATGSSS